jgi:putative DNA primase/helicase
MKDKLSTQTQGRWTDILNHMGIDSSYLRNKHGECPLCGGTDRFRYDNKDGTGSYFCSGCGPGDGAKLAMQFTGLSFKDCAAEVRKIIGHCKMEITTKTTDTAANEARLKKIHAGLKHITPNSIVAHYLSNRGITVLPETDCYFHPGIDYFEAGNSIGKFPCMVSVFRTSENKTATYHLTYLNSNGEKVGFSSPKKILPVIAPLTGSAIRLFKADDALCIAEGIETALAVHQRNGLPV